MKHVRKPLTLKQFFKMKRNQQVVVTSVIEKDVNVTTEGKVATIGRDFVMLTNLQKTNLDPLYCNRIRNTFPLVFLPIPTPINTLYMITNCSKNLSSNLARQWLKGKR